jgi:membrane glycosyltransferase
LWLAFLLTFNWMRWFHEYTGLSNITVRGLTPFLNVNGTVHAFIIFLICMSVLLLPKVVALVDLVFNAERRRKFGGLVRATAGAIVETIFSTLHAPLQMLWHTRFVVTNLLGISVGWNPQRRDADGTTWLYAIQRHWGHTLVGLVWGGLVWRLDRASFWWFAPVLAGMLLSIPLSVFTGRREWGIRARSLGMFLTPEETTPPPEIVSLRERMMALEKSAEIVSRPNNSGIADAVLDPYVNATHVSLLREKRFNPEYAEQLRRLGAGGADVRALGEKLLAQGPDKLDAREKMVVLCDAEVMSWLHRQIWLRADKKLSPWWLANIRHYAH